jgi:hypothetical protein
MSVVRNLMIRAGADFSSLRKEMKKAQKNVKEFKMGMNSALAGIGAALATLGIGAAIADATRSAMDVEAAMMQINRTMGTSAEEFKNWAFESASAYHMSGAAAIKYGAIYSNLISSFSGGTKETLTMTTDLLKASAVVAQGTGRDIQDVMWRIRSGLLGNTEAIEDLGLQVYVNLLKTTKAFRQFAGDKSWDQLDFQTQQLIRYYGIMEQANKKFGAEVMTNTNSALQAFKAALGDVKLSLGQAFLPILNWVLPILTALANKLHAIMSLFSQFTRAMFGFTDPSTTRKQGEAVDALADSYNKAGDEVDKAGKKAKRGLSGFDEINQISESNSSKGEGANNSSFDTGLPTELGNASALEPITEGVRAFANKVKAIFKDLSGFMTRHSDLIISAISGIGAALTVAFVTTNWSAIIGTITKAFAALRVTALTTWAAITGPAGLVAAAIALVVGAIVYFYRTNETFRTQVQNIWYNYLVPFGNWLSNVFSGVWASLSSAISYLWSNVLVPLGSWLGSVFMVIWKSLSSTLSYLWKTILVPLGAFIGEVFVSYFKTLTSVWKFLWKNVVVPFGSWLYDKLKPTLEAIKESFTRLHNTLSLIGAVIRDVLYKNFKIATEYLIKGAKWVGDSFLELLTFIRDVFSKDWSHAWETMKSSFSRVFSGLWNIAKTPLNKLIDAINYIIEGLNQIKIEIPDWVPGIGGKSFGVNIGKIPRLARGGIVDGKTNFGNYIAGESGSEMIVPLENTSFVDKLAGALGTAVMNAMQVTGGQNKGGEIVIQIDGTALARVLSPYTDKEGTRLGGSMIVAR